MVVKKKSSPVKRKPKALASVQKGTGVVKDAINYIKDHKLISKALSLIPHPIAQGASYLAGQAGLGKANMGGYRSSQMGDGFFTDIGNGIGGIARGLFGGGQSGDGRRRRPNIIKM